MLYLGKKRPGSTIYVPFATYGNSDPASITASNFAVTDIELYANGGTTQRSSDNGYTLLDTDGIDRDGVTGMQGFSINMADNSDAGFFKAGDFVECQVASITVDSKTVNFIPVCWDIGYDGSLYDTTIATLSSQTSFTLTSGPAEDNALVGMWAMIHDVASAVQCSRVLISGYTGSTKTVTLAAGATFTVAAGDNISIMGMAPLQPATLGRTLVVDAAGLADANTVKVGPSGSGTAQTAKDIGISVPGIAPDAAGGLRTSLQGPVTWYVQSTGSDSNSGLSRTSPLQTTAGADSVIRDGDTVWILGTISSALTWTPAKRIELTGDRGAILRCTAADVSTLTVTSNMNGSRIYGPLTINNNSATSLHQGSALSATSVDGLIVENGVKLSNGNGRAGATFTNCTGISLLGVIATGKSVGVRNYGSRIRSNSGEYTGGDHGGYADSGLVSGSGYAEAFWHSINDRFTGSCTGAAAVSTWSDPHCAGFFYECHDDGVTCHLYFENPTFVATATDASYADDLAGLQGEVSIPYYSAGDVVIHGGRCIVSNANTGSALTKHLSPNSQSTCYAFDHGHDSTKNSAYATIVNEDIANTKTRALLALPAVAPAANGGLPTGNASNQVKALDGSGNPISTAAALALVATDAGTAATQATAAASSAASADTKGTTTLARMGAWTGTGINTVLGAFKALLSKSASAPSDIGGTFDPATDSTEGIADTPVEVELSEEDIEDIAEGVAEAVSEQLSASFTDINLEPVPPSRTFKMVPSSDEGWTGEDTKSLMVGYETTFAADFASDLAPNIHIKSIDDVILLADSGITISKWGRDHSIAKWRVQATDAGTYEVEIALTYVGGSGGRGRVTFVVPEPQTEFEGGVPGTQEEIDLTDVDQEPVPVERTFVLTPTRSGLVAEAVKSVHVGDPARRYRIDFRNDLSANRGIATVVSVEVVEGLDTGVDIDTEFGRNGTGAIVTIGLSTAGSRTFNIAVVYANGDGARGEFTLVGVT